MCKIKSLKKRIKGFVDDGANRIPRSINIVDILYEFQKYAVVNLTRGECNIAIEEYSSNLFLTRRNKTWINGLLKDIYNYSLTHKIGINKFKQYIIDVTTVRRITDSIQ